MSSKAHPALAWCVSLVMVPVLGSMAAIAGTGTGTAEDHNRRVVTEAFDRWAAGGTSFFDDVLAETVVWRIEGSGPSAGVFRGRETFVKEAVLPFTTRLSTPVRPTASTVWADGDHVIAHWEGSAVARDGRDYNNRYAWILRMQDGKAVEVTAFLDLAPYDDVLRRIPAP